MYDWIGKMNHTSCWKQKLRNFTVVDSVTKRVLWDKKDNKVVVNIEFGVEFCATKHGLTSLCLFSITWVIMI